MSTSAACAFCDLIGSGSGRWVVQEADAVAFLPLPESMLAPGHTLVAPREHCVGVLDVSPETLSATMGLVRRVSLAMTKALGATGVVLLNASGPFSGQSVGHLHVHVVPRWPDDTVQLWPSARSAHPPVPDAAEKLAAVLR